LKEERIQLYSQEIRHSGYLQSWKLQKVRCPLLHLRYCQPDCHSIVVVDVAVVLDFDSDEVEVWDSEEENWS
jgi:hypothetical protein